MAGHTGSALSTFGFAPLARAAAAALVILMTGAIGLWGFFSDRRPGESLGLRIAFMTGAYLIGSGLVARLLPRQWYLAVLTAWGPMLFGGVGLYVELSHPEVPTRPSSMMVLLLGVPLIALAGGFLGRWYARGRRFKA